MYYGLVINRDAPTNVFGIGIGAVITIAHVTIGVFTGACVNPIRVFGPALLKENVQHLPMYIVSEFLGGLFAAYYFEFYIINKIKEPRLESGKILS